MMPGSRALAFASRWFPPATVSTVFEPLIADWQREWRDAPRAQRLAIQFKGVFAFGLASVVSTPAIARVRAPKSLTDQVARRIAWASFLGTAVFMTPLVGEIDSTWIRAWLILFAIPGALVLAFPFAMIAAVDTIRAATNVEPHVARATMAKLAALAVVFMVFTHGWVVPAANQLWRETTFQTATAGMKLAPGQSKPAKGLRELTSYELIASAELATAHEPGTYEYARARWVRMEMNNRATLAVLPVFLLWRRWRALDLPNGRWWSARHPILATIAAVAVFISLRGFFNSVEHAWSLPAGSGAWIELAVLAMIGMMRVWLVERSVARA
jgi:hypothetical protein